MTTVEILQSVQFVFDQDGKPTAAMLNMHAWESFMEKLEEIDDLEVIQKGVKNWRSKEGWTRWEDFERELEADELSNLD